MSTAVHMENKLWRSNSKLNLCMHPITGGKREHDEGQLEKGKNYRYITLCVYQWYQFWEPRRGVAVIGVCSFVRMTVELIGTFLC